MIQLLFVDDEPSVLEGLENRLRPWRREWQLRFAGSGDQALQMLDAAPAEVVVSDMRMPGMDGAALLKEVRGRYPETVRIILSGESDRDGVLRSLPVAHQFLSKPCDGERLRSVIHRCSALHDAVFSPQVKAAIAGVGTLPALPRHCLDLCAELDRAQPSVHRVAEIIEDDISMTARLLQVCNSAFFGFPRAVVSAREAVTLLGLEPVRAIVIAGEMFRAMAQLCQPSGFDLERVQSHVTQVAAIAQTLPEDPAVRSTALAAAMLHDLGRIVLALSMPADARRMAALVAAGKLTPIEMEREVFGCTHAEVGAHLLMLWGLPHALVEAVAFHHQPGALLGETFSAAGAVHVADWLAHRASPAAGMVGAPLDRDWLVRIGRLDRLEAWERRHARAPAPP